MRAVEFIRGLLDLLDTLEEPRVRTGVDSPFTSVEELLPCNCDKNEYKNEPNEKYANIHSTTTSAGGGVNGPKHPADIRGSSVNIYPRGE